MKKPCPTSSVLLDTEQVSRLLRVSTRHVQRLVSSARMPAPVRIGALVRWNRRSIEQWIDEGCPEVGLARSDESVAETRYRPR